jgi:hypothetical protein
MMTQCNGGGGNKLVELFDFFIVTVVYKRFKFTGFFKAWLRPTLIWCDARNAELGRLRSMIDRPGSSVTHFRFSRKCFDLLIFCSKKPNS